MKKALRGAILRAIVFLLYAYQHSLSVLLGPCCRFSPSCSSYACTSIERFGILRGGWLSLKRLGRCHPFHPGGYDPVPGTR